MLYDQVPEVIPHSRWYRVLHWEYLGLFVIIAISLVFHIIAIDRPPTIVWDEKWYVGDARSIISGTGELRPEHPPLAKLLIAAGDYIFNGFTAPEKDTLTETSKAIGSGSNDTLITVSDASAFTVGTTIRIDAEQMDVKSVDTVNNRIIVERGTGGTNIASHARQQEIHVFYDNAVEWRFFSIIFGTIGIVIFYFICRKLRFSWIATMAATFLFAFEDMTFLHSGLALLDIFMLTFMLAAVLFYLDNNYLLMGFCVALSALCKLDGVLIIFAIFLHWAIYRRNKLELFAGSLVVAALSFVFFLVFFDYFIYGSIENPITRITAMLSSTAANTFTDPKLSISSRPWTWIYPQWIQAYYNSPNVPFIVYSYDPQYISFISSTIQIMIIPTIGYMIYKVAKGSQPAALVVLWFISTYLIWIPPDIVSNRVTFVFYFLNTTPAICIGLGMAISDARYYLQDRRVRYGRITNGMKISYAVIAFYLTLHLAIFVVFNPAIPTIIKTWLPPFIIGVDTSSAVNMLPLIFCGRVVTK